VALGTTAGRGEDTERGSGATSSDGMAAGAVVVVVVVVGAGTSGGGVSARLGAAEVAGALGAALPKSGISTGGGVTTGAGAVAAGLGGGAGVGVGVAAGRRDSGTSGATGPCRSGGACVVDGAGGRRKSLAGGAAESGAASTTAAEARVELVERISVTADMGSSAE